MNPPTLPIDALPPRERPAYRVSHASAACSLIELLAVVVGGPDAVDTAYRLVSRFGSAAGLARATASELATVKGVGPAAAARLRAAVEVGRRLEEPGPESKAIQSPADAAAVLRGRMALRDQESLYVLLLDTRNRVMGEPIELYRGSLNTSVVRVGEVFKDAVRANAAAVIVAHGHPSGDPSPSPEDVAVTRSLVEAGKLLDCQLLDHLIIGSEHRFVSLKERGLGFA